VKYEKIFNEALLKINDALAYVQFELRACRNQYDGKVYYAGVNNVADDQSQLGTKYSAPQIAFYKGVLCNLLLTFYRFIFLICKIVKTTCQHCDLEQALPFSRPANN
jgi:Nse1 non-SMC component of SMC5-6 complex